MLGFQPVVQRAKLAYQTIGPIGFLYVPLLDKLETAGPREEGSARLRRAIALVKLSHLGLPWALLPHIGEDSNASASGASVLGELYAQLTQCLFSA